MKKLILLSLFFLATNVFSSEILSLECYGSGEETLMNKTQILQNTKFDNFVRRYEFTQNGFTEYISTITLDHTRKDIEKNGNEQSHHDGYYRFEKSLIAYSENEDSDRYKEFSRRQFQIDRKTTLWSLFETYKGGMTGLYGDDVIKTLKVNGNCRLWDSKEKF
jgi:hypothetical protein